MGAPCAIASSAEKLHESQNKRMASVCENRPKPNTKEPILAEKMDAARVFRAAAWAPL